MTSGTEIKIGTKYRRIGRSDETWTVIDVLKTYNSACELVKVRYVSSKPYMRDNIVDHDVVATTILRGILPD